MRHLALAALLVACGSTPEAAPPPASTVVSPPASIAPPTTPAIDPCAIGRERIAAVTARAHATADPGAWELSGLDALAAQLGATCTTTGGGAWIVLLEDATAISGTTTLRTTSHVAFVDASGAVHVGGEALGIELDSEMEGTGSIRFERAFDWDGDGTVEVIALLESHYYEDTTRLRLVLAYHDAVAPYAPAADIGLERVVDADTDGRPDLVGRWHDWRGADCGEDPPVVGTPAVLFHSLADGTFSTSDSVAAAFLRAACPSAPTQLLGHDWPCGEQRARETIACARAWGVTAAEVRARLATERTALSLTAQALGEWDALDTYAGVEPPLVLH
jgi:hypothetical protein